MREAGRKVVATGSQRDRYDDEVIRWGVMATAFWCVVGLLVGVVIASQLAFPLLNLNLEYTTFGRLRPLHTSAVIFAFGGNALICTSYYVVQRTCRTRLAFPALARFRQKRRLLRRRWPHVAPERHTSAYGLRAVRPVVPAVRRSVSSRASLVLRLVFDKTPDRRAPRRNSPIRGTALPGRNRLRVASLLGCDVAAPNQAFADAVLALDDSVPTGTYVDMCSKLPVVDPLQIAVPTLVLRGQYDGIAAMDDLVEFWKRLPNPDKQFTVMAGISHASFQQKNYMMVYHILHSYFTQPAPVYR